MVTDRKAQRTPPDAQRHTAVRISAQTHVTQTLQWQREANVDRTQAWNTDMVLQTFPLELGGALQIFAACTGTCITSRGLVQLAAALMAASVASPPYLRRQRLREGKGQRQGMGVTFPGMRYLHVSVLLKLSSSVPLRHPAVPPPYPPYTPATTSITLPTSTWRLQCRPSLFWCQLPPALMSAPQVRQKVGRVKRNPCLSAVRPLKTPYQPQAIKIPVLIRPLIRRLKLKRFSVKVPQSQLANTTTTRRVPRSSLCTTTISTTTTSFTTWITSFFSNPVNAKDPVQPLIPASPPYSDTRDSRPSRRRLSQRKRPYCLGTSSSWALLPFDCARIYSPTKHGGRCQPPKSLQAFRGPTVCLLISGLWSRSACPRLKSWSGSAMGKETTMTPWVTGDAWMPMGTSCSRCQLTAEVAISLPSPLSPSSLAPVAAHLSRLSLHLVSLSSQSDVTALHL